MNEFTPIRPPSTRLVIALPEELRSADRALTKRATSAQTTAAASQAARKALDIAVPPKARALAGFLQTLRPDQPTAVITRNTIERNAALRAAAGASARPTTNIATWQAHGGTLIIQPADASSDINIAQALYAIFLGRPVRIATMKKLEHLAAFNGPKEPPFIVHLIAEPSLDSKLATLLLDPNP